jgi:hypothetical protein
MSSALTFFSSPPSALPSPRSPRSTLCRWTARARVCRGLLIAVPALAGALLAPSGCEGEQRGRDASAPPILQTAEVSIRFDVGSQKGPAMSVLAFQAAVTRVSQRDVLGIVDPLAAAAPDHDCELRDLDLSAGALVARGGSIELQELGGIGITLGASGLSSDVGAGTIVRPFPRLFPDVATVVGGVVAEAGPLQLVTLPERVGLLTPASELPLEELAVPAAPRIASVNGAPLAAGAKLDARDGLTITVSGGSGTVVELRPFGATVAIACSVPETAVAENTIVVPRPLVARLSGGTTMPSGAAVAGAAGAAVIPASLDVLSRAHVRVSPFAMSSRLSIEVRASTAVEIRP